MARTFYNDFQSIQSVEEVEIIGAVPTPLLELLIHIKTRTKTVKLSFDNYSIRG